PAPWTIILGVNGTGKTTVLQSLVGFEFVPFPDNHGVKASGNRFFHFTWEILQSYPRRWGQEATSWSVHVATSPHLTAVPSRREAYRFEMREEGRGIDMPCGPLLFIAPLWCCAYGAGRRVGAASLSESGTADPTASLFSDKAELRNPEEWLLRLDYAA